MFTPFKLERFFAEFEFTSKYLMSSSDVESMKLSQLLDFEPGARDRLQELWLGYTESTGSPALRESIGKLYENVRPENVLVHVGAQEAIYCFFKTCFQAGDHIIVMKPTYQSLYSVAKDSGIEVSDWSLRLAKGKWEVDTDELEGLVRSSTKALIMNMPNSPTGFLISSQQQDEIIKFCRKHGLVMFSDEVYRELEYSEASRLVASCDAYEKGVSVGVLSKAYGLAGLRLGWLASQDADIISKVAIYKDFTSICTPAPSEFLGRIGLQHHRALAKRAREIIFENLKTAKAFFQEFENIFQWIPPQAGPVSLAELKIGGAEKFARTLQSEAGVLLLPSSVFDMEDKYVRFGFGRTSVTEGFQVLSDCLRKL